MNDGYTTKLNHLFQKSVRYKHFESLELDLILAGLKIKKLPAIIPVTSNFYSEWNKLLHKAEKWISEFIVDWIFQSSRKTKRDVEVEMRIQYPMDYDRKRIKVEEQYENKSQKLTVL